MRVWCSFVIESNSLFFTVGKAYFLESEGGIADDSGFIWKTEEDQKTIRICKGDASSLIVATFEEDCGNGFNGLWKKLLPVL